MLFKNKFWLKFSIFNLFIVAFLGLIMRYKIGFEFPYLNQKNLQHSHSHFAFAGWVSQTLMVLMIGFLTSKINYYRKSYDKILAANLLCSYGMLISFALQGYNFISIFFSTSSIVVACFFGYYYFKDLKLINKNCLSIYWFKAAIGFNIFSSIGTFYLAYMMATKNIVQDFYLASVYYYLHFQYNGWFFFACMGLFFGYLSLQKSDNQFIDNTFKLFFFTCIPTYFLSTLWLDLPIWLYVITVIATLLQTFAWFKFLLVILKNKLKAFNNYPLFLRYILLFIAVSVSIKFLLQLGITIPYISKLAFGFRPVIIAYLHLVLLAIISLFLLFYIYANPIFHYNKQIKFGLILFSLGVLFNEIVLATQGIAAFSYTLIPHVNEILFGITVIMVLGVGIISFYTIKKTKFYPVL